MSRSLSTVFVVLVVLLLALSFVDAFPTCQKTYRGGFHCTGHYGHNATAKVVRRLVRRQSCIARFSSTAVSSTASISSSTPVAVPTTSSVEPSATFVSLTSPPAQASTSDANLLPSPSLADTASPDPAPSATPTLQPTTSEAPQTSSSAPTSSSGSGSDSGSGGSSSSSSSSTSDSDISEYLADHNNFRAQYDASPLTWNNTLAATAQGWANNCVFQHSGGTLGPYGENLAAGTGSSYGIDAAIQSWTNESSQYDASNPVASHFTQVVWKATTQVGCAVSECSGIFPSSFGEAQYYVCEYFPQGNVIGEFAENVQ